MKAKIIRSHNFRNLNTEVGLNTQPHNLKYSHTTENCMYFQILRYPRKEILKHLSETEDGEIVLGKGFIRAAVKKQGTCMCFIVHYQVKTEPGQQLRKGEKSKCLVTEKEKLYVCSAEKSKIVQLLNPYLFHFAEVNDQESNRVIIQFFNGWANPKTFEEIKNQISYEQERKAVEILRAYFDL